MSQPSSAAEAFGDLSRHTLRGRPRHILRRFLMILLRPLIKIEGDEHVPPEGPMLVVANHLHNADPFLVALAMPRPLHFMAKLEVFRIPVLREFVRWNGAFPVDRGKADRKAIRHAEANLAQGIAVGIFPEGTRSVTRSLRPAHAGAGLIALRSGVPVVPIIVTGSERLPFNGGKARRADGLPEPDPGHRGIRLRIGPPFTIPREIDGRKVNAQAATDMMMAALARMLPPDYQGAYADSNGTKDSQTPSHPLGDDAAVTLSNR